jgi:dTDP-4-dehydrorhamnose reductase
MINVLVTGASGQLGRTIQELGVNYPEIDFIFKNSKELDITNNTYVNNVFEEVNFNYCINCAAYTNVEQAEKTPEIAFKVNADGAKNIANACKTNDVILIHISTDYVFDGEKKDPYSVNDLPNPINEYGKSKLLGETNIQEILDDYFIIRTSWLYSKVHGKNFYKTIIAKAQKGELIKVTDQQFGCPTNAENLTKYLLHIISINSNNYGIHHYTDGNAMTWFDFAFQILQNNGFKPSLFLVKDRNYRTFAKRPVFSVLKTQK